MEDPYGCTESEHTGLRVGGPLQQTHAGGMNPLRAQSNTRWQCVSVASGHLAGCLDRKVCCKRLWDPAVQSSWMVSQRFLYGCRAARSLSARSHKADAKKITVCRVKEEAPCFTRQGREKVLCFVLLGAEDSL